MKNLLIIYHTQSGHTEQLAYACKSGAEREEVNVKLIKAATADIQDIEWCHGVLIGTPENFGTMSGIIKDFFDRTYYPSRDLGLIRPYGLFVSCDTDGTGTDREIQKIANGYILKKAIDTIIIRGEIQKTDLDRMAEMGQTLAAGLLLDIY